MNNTPIDNFALAIELLLYMAWREYITESDAADILANLYVQSTEDGLKALLARYDDWRGAGAFRLATGWTQPREEYARETLQERSALAEKFQNLFNNLAEGDLPITDALPMIMLFMPPPLD